VLFLRRCCAERVERISGLVYSGCGWLKPFLLVRSLTSLAHFTRSLHSLTSLAHFTHSLTSLTRSLHSLAHFTHSLTSLTSLAHFTSLHFTSLTHFTHFTRSLHSLAHFTHSLTSLTRSLHSLTSLAHFTRSLHSLTHYLLTSLIFSTSSALRSGEMRLTFRLWFLPGSMLRALCCAWSFFI